MFNLASNFGYLGQKEVSTHHVEAVVTQHSHEAGLPSRSVWGLTPYRHDKKIKQQIAMAYDAYSVEGIIKQIVDTFSEQFVDFDLEGGPKQVKKLKSRLALMSLQSGEEWKTTISRVVNEYFKTGNVFLMKFRGWGPVIGQRPLYKNRPFTLSSFEVFSSMRLDTHYNADNIFDGWYVSDMFEKEKVQLVKPGSTRLNDTLALIEVTPSPTDKSVYTNSVDISHITYKRGANTRFGQGMILPGLEDWSIIRGLELNVAVMLKKFSMPTIHHKIKKVMTPIAGHSNEIREAEQLWQRQAPDGVIVTPDHHEIKPIGSESQAIRSEGYLKYYINRGIVSVGSSPFLVGVEAGGIGAIAAAKENMLNRVRWAQKDIARQLRYHLFDEILWEEGFDPYRNEDDQVHLVFGDVDKDATIKQESHSTDMFTKNAIDHDQLQARLKNKKPVNTSKLFSNMIAKPETEHASKVDADSKIKVVKATPKPRTSVSRKELNNYLPETESDITDFLYILEHSLGFDPEYLESISSNITELLDDHDAIIELLNMKLMTT